MWTVIDPYIEDIKYVEHRGFLTVKFDCTSKYFYLWTTLTIVYTIFLSLVVVTVAVKSRNIRMKQFKDTKKVNMFIFLFIFSGLTLYAYWRVFDVHEDFSIFCVYVNHLILAILCQIFLFVPKVWPPVRNKFLSKTVSDATINRNVREYTSTTVVSTRLLD